jgi:hypothetical protein
MKGLGLALICLVLLYDTEGTAMNNANGLVAGWRFSPWLLDIEMLNYEMRPP